MSAGGNGTISNLAAYTKSISENREQFLQIIGAVDPRVKQLVFEFLTIPGHSGVIASSAGRPALSFKDKNSGQSFRT